jgi:hypothetical protein
LTDSRKNFAIHTGRENFFAPKGGKKKRPRRLKKAIFVGENKT